MADGALCEVWFYHLERSGLEQVLPELLEKTLQRGWRARVSSASRDRLEQVDNWLWTYRDDSFLPHGVVGDAFDARQPVLLGPSGDNRNNAQALFVLDGDPGDLTTYERCIVIFDGRQEAPLMAARQLWTGFRKAGHAVTYWRQGESRGWEKQG